MLRMASLLPFGTTNFVLAALDCPLRAYAIGTLGLIPYIFTCKASDLPSGVDRCA